MPALSDQLMEDLTALMEKHQLTHGVLIVPMSDDTIQLAVTNMSEQQVWIICDELAQRFHEQPHPLNG